MVPRVQYRQGRRRTPRESLECARSRMHRARHDDAGSPSDSDFPSPSRTSLPEQKPFPYQDGKTSCLALLSTHQDIRNRPEEFMGLLRIARTPLVTVHPDTSVMDAVRTMDNESIGAVAVTEGNVLVGMFSERDLMLRVVVDKRDPERTRV